MLKTAAKSDAMRAVRVNQNSKRLAGQLDNELKLTTKLHEAADSAAPNIIWRFITEQHLFTSFSHYHLLIRCYSKNIDYSCFKAVWVFFIVEFSSWKLFLDFWRSEISDLSLIQTLLPLFSSTSSNLLFYVHTISQSLPPLPPSLPIHPSRNWTLL